MWSKSETVQVSPYLLSMISAPFMNCMYLSLVWDLVMITAVAEESNYKQKVFQNKRAAGADPLCRLAAMSPSSAYLRPAGSTNHLQHVGLAVLLAGAPDVMHGRLDHHQVGGQVHAHSKCAGGD